MKDILINNPQISRDLNFSNRLEFLLKNKFKRSSLWIKGVEVFSDIKYNTAARPSNARLNSAAQAFTHYSLFVAEYINLILYNNTLAEERKSGPYDIFFSINLDAEGRKTKLHIYLDSDIFGLIAGAKYCNLISLIRASFPIFSKIGFEVEVKLFSLQEKQKEPRYQNKGRPRIKEEDLPDIFADDNFADDNFADDNFADDNFADDDFADEPSYEYNEED
jgi:hypothetical protein